MPSCILSGTPDLLNRNPVSPGPQHSYGILSRIEQISGRSLLIEQGALCPALYRLESQGLISPWRRRLRDEVAQWSQLVGGMAMVLSERAPAR